MTVTGTGAGKERTSTRACIAYKKQAVATAATKMAADFAAGRAALSAPSSKLAQAQAGASILEGASLGAAV